jgi:hypothetical protein
VRGKFVGAGTYDCVGAGFDCFEIGFIDGTGNQEDPGIYSIGAFSYRGIRDLEWIKPSFSAYLRHYIEVKPKDYRKRERLCAVFWEYVRRSVPPVSLSAISKPRYLARSSVWFSTTESWFGVR